MSVQSTPPRLSDAQLLRNVFEAIPTGIIVLTTGGQTPFGVSVTAFNPVSMEPPLVLVCVRRDSAIYPRLTRGFFGISVLATGQEWIARRFAEPAEPAGTSQFEGIDCRPGPVTGIPLLTGSLARFECELWNVRPAGDHSIVLGRLLSLDRTGTNGDQALLWRGRGRGRRGPGHGSDSDSDSAAR